MVEGEHIRFGTSGLLYRSNKLMFDHGTRSLWNTFEGVPVLGTLVGSGRRLTHRSVVTTTWGEWRRMHPGTTVLSLDTGHQRDYGEGVAYRAYFRTDDLMFDVPERDDRLDNKDEVLVMLVEDAEGARRPPSRLGRFPRGSPSPPGRARRAPAPDRDEPRGGEPRLRRRLDDLRAARRRPRRPSTPGGGRWQVTEDALIEASDPARRAPRVAAQRAFWFGWYSQFPETRLVR